MRLLALVLIVAGCGGTKATGPGAESSPKQAVEQTAKTATVAECPLFCDRVGSSCKHPDIKSAPDSCGVYGNGQLPPPTIDCPAECCVQATADTGDSDADGIVDSADKCPNDPEDRDGFQDSDGCPDGDNDQDGVLDFNDKCCYQAEDQDGVEDLDGCPEPN
jgi:hypothetical protein